MSNLINIVTGLNAKKIGDGKYKACCPAHDDKNPSLSITEKDGRVLFYCHSGCTQTEVIQVLISRGLWKLSKKNDVCPEYPARQLLYYRLFMAVYIGDKKLGKNICESDLKILKQAKIVLESYGSLADSEQVRSVRKLEKEARKSR